MALARSRLGRAGGWLGGGGGRGPAPAAAWATPGPCGGRRRVGGGVVADATGSGFGAAALWFGSVIVAMGRLPLFAALPMAVVALTAYGVLQGSDNALTGVMTSAGIVLVGYVSRLDSEA